MLKQLARGSCRKNTSSPYRVKAFAWPPEGFAVKEDFGVKVQKAELNVEGTGSLKKQRIFWRHDRGMQMNCGSQRLFLWE